MSHLVSAAMAEYHRERKDAPVTVQEGDVLIPAGLTGGTSGTGEVQATVAGPDDDGTRLGQHRSLLRPDPTQFDAWFLAGFLMAPGSAQQASYGTSALRIDARRLEIPLLPLADQRRYGDVFQRLRAAESAAARVTDLTAELTALLAEGLTDGTLLPPGTLGNSDDA